MLTQEQTTLVRHCCARPASGSPIVLGIYERDGTVGFDTMSEILGHDNYELLDNVMDDRIENDRKIKVVRHVDRFDGEFMRGLLGRLRFRHQIILIMEGGQHSDAFLSRVMLVNPADRPEKG